MAAWMLNNFKFKIEYTHFWVSLFSFRVHYELLCTVTENNRERQKTHELLRTRQLRNVCEHSVCMFVLLVIAGNFYIFFLIPWNFLTRTNSVPGGVWARVAAVVGGCAGVLLMSFLNGRNWWDMISHIYNVSDYMLFREHIFRSAWFSTSYYYHHRDCQVLFNSATYAI